MFYVAFSLTPKETTLKDLNGHFMFNYGLVPACVVPVCCTRPTCISKPTTSIWMKI